MLGGDLPSPCGVAEPQCGHWYVFWRYLYIAIDLGPLAVQEGPCPGSNLVRESLPDKPGEEDATNLSRVQPSLGGCNGWVEGRGMLMSPKRQCYQNPLD
jgi:hypothetical protein